WPGATTTSCRGRTTSTSTTSFPTARSIHSTPVTSRGSKQGTNTAASSLTGSAADIGASKRARRHLILLGEDARSELRRATSLDALVTPSSPPFFLWHTAEDAYVPPEHTYRLAASLAAYNAPHAV